MRDYLAERLQKKELKHFGVKGMKWGVRKSDNYKGTGMSKKMHDELDAHFEKYVKAGDTSPAAMDKYYKERDEIIKKHAKKQRLSRSIGVADDVTSAVRVTNFILDHSDDVPDYVGHRVAEEGDQVAFGIKGMKWGVRRSDAEIASDIKSRKASGEPVTNTEKAKAISSGSETSQQRYARLKGEAKGGGQKTWSDEDLKFFNSRTEAEAKVAKMFEEKPGWLSETSQRVLKNAAQRTMQDIANGVTQKYITSKLLESLNDNSAAIKAESKTPIDYVGRHRAKSKK